MARASQTHLPTRTVCSRYMMACYTMVWYNYGTVQYSMYRKEGSLPAVASSLGAKKREERREREGVKWLR